jgi:ParB family chromosome partitioning protein
LHQPILIRETQGKQGYEILSGHNRVEAIRRLGYQDIPAIIRDVDDATAALIVVTTNLEQRETLLPSEKAFAYRLQMEALQNGENPIIKRGRKPSDANGSDNSVQIEPDLLSRAIVANGNRVSDSEIQRYIRLTYLIPEMLDQLDQDHIPIMAGYEMSFLDAEAQQVVHQHFTSSNEKLSIKTAETLRAAYQAGKPITAESIPEILVKPPKKKPAPKEYSIPKATLRKFDLPDDFDFSAFVLRMLEREYQRR